MAWLDKTTSGPKEGKVPAQSQTPAMRDAEKGPDAQGPAEPPIDDESLSGEAQAGVKAVQAAITVWSKYHLWGAYAMYVPRTPPSKEPLVPDRVPASGGSTSS